MDTAVWAALAVAGLLAGIGIGFWLGRLQSDGERVAELETELETYRAKVTEHFAQSATHFQAIGKQYKELYEHMAVGSEALCAPEAKATMSFPAPGEVSALAEPAEPVEPPVEAAAAATDVADLEVIETTPYETDALTEEAASAEAAEVLVEEPAEPVAEAPSTDEVESADEPPEALAASDDTTNEAAVPAETVGDTEPEKRLYH